MSALLVLEDGTAFAGQAWGARGTTVGEAVFSTGMTGYQETLTDPSYHRQIVVATAPHIGNTGVNDDDRESARIWVAGYVVRDPARRPSNWRSERSLEDELVGQGIVGISGVDTRALTRHLRERGAMRAGIASAGPGEQLPTTAGLLETVRGSASMTGSHLSGEVSTTAPYRVPASAERRFTVAPVMMGERGMDVVVVPEGSGIEDVLAQDPDGVFVSNGPGDPGASEPVVELVREVLARGMPFFGICFGNQIFGRALGLGTFKLRYGHHGINQPVADLITGKVEVTAHNHGFAVDAPIGVDLPTEFGTARVSHVCLNDDVVEGLELRDRPGTDGGELLGFSVQYHPEAAAGPHDAAYLFDRFADLMAARTAARAAAGTGR